MSEGRLLILDDDPMIGQTIQRVAEFAGLGVRFTTDPTSFFELVDSWAPTHIALDLIMPEMDGVEVMTALARHGCRARIIITSGVGNRVLDAAGRSAEEHGLDIAGVLAKPFSSMTLKRLLLTAAPSAPATGSGATLPTPSATITEEMLLDALERGHIHVAFQPKVRCRDGVLAGFEALARWHHPLYGTITPDRFIPLAESGGLIDRLTERVLDEALHWFSGEGLGSRMPASVTLSINLSAKSLVDRAWVERVGARCGSFAIAPERVIFELTETSAMDDPVMSLDLLTRLRMKGFQLSIDDFGTGYSSMLQLVRLPFSEIKVDKSFVMTASHSAESRAVIRSVITLGHALGLQCVAEGVEDEETLASLHRMDCDLAQGYYIARPMPPDHLREWLRKADFGVPEART